LIRRWQDWIEMRTRRPLVAGNWKMHGLRASAAELAKIIQGAREMARTADLLVCSPATLIAQFAGLAEGSPLRIGGQDCHAQASGAFTGDISAEMLKDAGASAVIVGHSERRRYHRETNQEVRAKALAAQRAGLTPIVCVGETRTEREGGQAAAIVQAQLDGSLSETGEPLVVAYEPVWAIGTGLTPTPGDVAEMHGLIRRHLGTRFGSAGQGIRILYGGSVKASNAAELMAVSDVDGALVGGASLKADEFLAIAAVYR
jgi:triosephosphate isomerase (TIM)